MKRLLWLLPLLAVFPFAGGACAHATRVAKPAGDGVPALAVTTFNVNYGIPGDEATVAAIESAGADLVFLQETTAQWQAACAARLRAVYPHQVWVDAPGAGGQAVLAKRPFAVRDVIEAPTGWFPGVRVVAQTPLGEVQVLSVHLHPPVSESGSWVSGSFTTGSLRRSEVQAFAEALDPALPTLVVGDFNEGTSGDAVRWLEGRGLRSVLPEYAPKAKTWRWDVGALRLTAQLDHIAYDARLEPVEARVVNAGRSDHLPVRAVFVAAPAVVRRGPAPEGSSLSVGLR